MRANLELFVLSGMHPEPIIDAYYNKDKVVITATADQTNRLIDANNRLVELITVFGYLLESGKGLEDAEISKIVAEATTILTETEGINFSPFSQFLMVYNSSHSSFVRYAAKEQKEFMFEMLKLYVLKRHKMYLSHGYSNSILQVMCDNYSHKRNSKSTIIKVSDILGEFGFRHNPVSDKLCSGRHYILPDKGDRDAFHDFRNRQNIIMESAANEQGKLPDMVFHLDGEYYVVEMKSMKGSGGGQDKQLTEIINFIRYAEANPRVHYVTYLDGEYSNILHSSRQPKIRRQYDDILGCLQKNPGNYFLNTTGFREFMRRLTAGLAK